MLLHAEKITESEIEKFAIELLEKQGYQYIYAPSIATDGKKPWEYLDEKKKKIPDNQITVYQTPDGKGVQPMNMRWITY